MKAMVLEEITYLKENSKPLKLREMDIPSVKKNELLIRISACGVCHTELDEIEGRTPPTQFPIILGHEVVGYVEKIGDKVKIFNIGDRVGVGWIYDTCGLCVFCRSGQENLCADFKATGRDVNGGYAEFIKVVETSAFQVPDLFTDTEAAPLMCAGAIGFRSLNLTGLVNGQKLGLTGFGASAHLVLKMAKHKFPDSPIYVFARNPKECEFAIELGATWAGNTEASSPELLDKVIDTTPVWKPIVEAMKNLTPGGRLVINAIRKESVDKDYLNQLNYSDHLWMEKEIKSVANVARSDIQGFLDLASEIPIRPEVKEYPLEDANQALVHLKAGNLRGAKVLIIKGNKNK